MLITPTPMLRQLRRDPSPLGVLVLLVVAAVCGLLALYGAGRAAGRPGVLALGFVILAAVAGLYLRHLREQARCRAEFLTLFAPHVRPVVAQLVLGELHEQAAPFQYAIGRALQTARQAYATPGGGAVVRVWLRPGMPAEWVTHPAAAAALADYWGGGLAVRVRRDPGHSRAVLLEIRP